MSTELSDDLGSANRIADFFSEKLLLISDKGLEP
jgi:hypothetical protein